MCFILMAYEVSHFFMDFFSILYLLLILCLKCLQAMVARGDLGAELPIEDVPLLQASVLCSPSCLLSSVDFFVIWCSGS